MASSNGNPLVGAAASEDKGRGQIQLSGGAADVELGVTPASFVSGTARTVQMTRGVKLGIMNTLDVTVLEPGGQAEKAGVQVGWRVVAVNEQATATTEGTPTPPSSKSSTAPLPPSLTLVTRPTLRLTHTATRLSA